MCETYCGEYKHHYGKSFECRFNGKEKIKQLLLKNPNVPLEAGNDHQSHYRKQDTNNFQSFEARSSIYIHRETENDFKLIQATEEVCL